MKEYIELLKLQKHSAGGYYGIVHQSDDKVIPLHERYKSNKNVNEQPFIAGFSFYFLLGENEVLTWRKQKSDQIWHYYDGKSPIDFYVIDEKTKKVQKICLGPSEDNLTSFQIVIKAGAWFAAKTQDKSSVLVGCTASPGDGKSDFEIADCALLKKCYPEFVDVINKFISTTPPEEEKEVLGNQSDRKRTSTSKEYVEKLGLERHIEGGHFCVFYKSDELVKSLKRKYVKTENAGLKENERFSGSSIYFLLEKHDFSAWHRLKSDEVWHYYAGSSPIDIHVINEAGELITYSLGNPRITKNANFQVVLKSGLWFSAEVRDKTSFALVGCTVSPGFEYNDFELADRKKLVTLYPHLRNVIDTFTRVPKSTERAWSKTSVSLAVLTLISGFGIYAAQKGLFGDAPSISSFTKLDKWF